MNKRKRKIALLFNVGVPIKQTYPTDSQIVMNKDLVKLKANQIADKLEGLGFKTFVRKHVETLLFKGTVWYDEFRRGSHGSSTRVLAIKEMESWRYKQAILKDLHELKVLPQQGVELEIRPFKLYGEITQSGRRIKRKGFIRSNWIKRYPRRVSQNLI